MPLSSAPGGTIEPAPVWVHTGVKRGATTGAEMNERAVEVIRLGPGQFLV